MRETDTTFWLNIPHSLSLGLFFVQKLNLTWSEDYWILFRRESNISNLSLLFKLVSLHNFNEPPTGFCIILRETKKMQLTVPAIDIKYVKFPICVQLSTIPVWDKSPSSSFFFPFSINVNLSAHHGRIMTGFYKLLHLFYFLCFSLANWDQFSQHEEKNQTKNHLSTIPGPYHTNSFLARPEASGYKFGPSVRRILRRSDNW